MEPADVNVEEESEPEMEPVESENSSTTNPNREFRNCKENLVREETRFYSY